jgi:hypothetical protein
MANKRYQETQDAGESSRKLRANLRDHPMPPQKAARVICDVHKQPLPARRGIEPSCHSTQSLV